MLQSPFYINSNSFEPMYVILKKGIDILRQNQKVQDPTILNFFYNVKLQNTSIDLI